MDFLFENASFLDAMESMPLQLSNQLITGKKSPNYLIMKKRVFEVF